MARIAGVDLPKDKRIEIGLTCASATPTATNMADIINTILFIMVILVWGYTGSHH